MGKSLTVELPDAVYEAVTKAAEAWGKSPAEWVVLDLCQRLPPAEVEPSVRQAIRDAIAQTVQQMAARKGVTLDEAWAEWRAQMAPKSPPDLTEEEARAAWERLSRHFGAVNSGHPHGADNERIDADLAREYDSNHAPKAP